jgi:bacteriorhodopsin
MMGDLYPLVKGTFSITYILLITTGTIIFIEALRNGAASFTSHVMNLETAISIVAGYFYSKFITEIERSEETNTHLNWEKINKYRYVDWSITTPIMLLVLCMFLANNAKTTIHVFTYFTIVVLNYIMLGFGYLGETNITSRKTGLIGGFSAFFLMFGIIYTKFVRPKWSMSSNLLFGLYLLVWSLYGVVYLFDTEMKNALTNILDLISKCFVGLGLWAYYTNILVT